MNTVLFNNPNNDGVWRAWTISKEKALTLEYAVAFTPNGLRAYVINDSYRMATLKDVNPQDAEHGYDPKQHTEKELFDLTEITGSRLGRRLINEVESFVKAEDFRFGQNPVSYAFSEFK